MVSEGLVTPFPKIKIFTMLIWMVLEDLALSYDRYKTTQWQIQVFPQVGVPTPQRAAPTYDFAKISLLPCVSQVKYVPLKMLHNGIA